MYDVTIKPKSSIVSAADGDTATRTKVGTHQDVSYTVGDPAILIEMSKVNISATTTLSPTTVPVMETEIKLYHDAVTTEITAASHGTFLSQTADTTCMTNFITATKAFHVYCTDQTKFQYPNGSKSFTIIYKLQYVQVSGVPANPATTAIVD